MSSGYPINVPDATLSNPFAALTVVVAPAILTNASSVLCLGTANRIARVVDRTRHVAGELAALQDQGSRAFQIRVRQLELLNSRATRLFWALRLMYASLGLFATTALIAVIGSVMSYYSMAGWFQFVAVCGLATFVFAVLGLASGCVLMVREVQMALESLTEEAQLAREHYQP